jgi:glycosyltransferase 2 family protein
MKQSQLNHIKSKEYHMLNKKVKDNLIFAVKVSLSIAAITYVLKKVNFDDIVSIIKSAGILYMIFAFLFFVISKLISADRTLMILRQYKVPISIWDNLKLYWTGMFYNIFLPGGIGGDIYKTIEINRLHRNGIKISAGSVLMDRIAGVTALIFLALLCLPFTRLWPDYKWYTLAAVPFTILSFIIIILIFMPDLKSIIVKLFLWSFLVQIFQTLTILMILFSFSVKTDLIAYILIFLVSSIAAMLPVSVGGIGIRELVFLSFSNYLILDKQFAVAISLMFYLISVLASSLGAISALERKTRKSVNNLLMGTSRIEEGR